MSLDKQYNDYYKIAVKNILLDPKRRVQYIRAKHALEQKKRMAERGRRNRIH